MQIIYAKTVLQEGKWRKQRLSTIKHQKKQDFSDETRILATLEKDWNVAI